MNEVECQESCTKDVSSVGVEGVWSICNVEVRKPKPLPQEESGRKPKVRSEFKGIGEIGEEAHEDRDDVVEEASADVEDEELKQKDEEDEEDDEEEEAGGEPKGEDVSANTVRLKRGARNRDNLISAACRAEEPWKEVWSRKAKRRKGRIDMVDAYARGVASCKCCESLGLRVEVEDKHENQNGDDVNDEMMQEKVDDVEGQEVRRNHSGELSGRRGKACCKRSGCEKKERVCGESGGGRQVKAQVVVSREGVASVFIGAVEGGGSEDEDRR